MTDITLTLVMIIKNESKIIERCLNSVKQYVDHIVITDTGSTDNTVEIVNNYLKSNSIKGQVFQDEWKNFGYNRTNSVKNGQLWLDNNNIDKSKNYFLTIDADMLIIFENFEKSQLAKEKAWSIIQMNSAIKYYNLRFFRSDLPYYCAGVTHEYWTCDNDSSRGKLDSVHIDDRGDGGCKDDKFKRDISLLTKGIEDEPNNHRYYFYLAQSYGDTGDVHNAIKWYTKRIQAGGWYEEQFISYKRIGELYMSIKEEEKAIFNWIKAYELIPQRSETIYRIANHYRNIGNNNSSLIFVKKGLEIPYPNNLDLFLEYNIYDYRFIEELGIIGYYVNKKHEGLIACQYLQLNKNVEGHVRDCAIGNSYFYMNKLSDKKVYHKLIDLKVETPYISSSPCLVYDNDSKKYRGVVRTVNYSIDDNFSYHIRDSHNKVKTQNIWVELDEECKVEKSYVLDSSGITPKRNSHIEGFEDIRICYVDYGDTSQLYGLAVSWEYGYNNHPSVVLIHFGLNRDRYTIDKAIPITYNDNICQKNWTLYSESGKLYTIYSHDPLTILEIDVTDGSYKVVTDKANKYNYNFSDIRGSTNPIKVGDDWLILVHQVMHKETRKYYHRFLRYSSDWELLDVSEPFYFNHLFVEFSLSVMYDERDKDVIIAYSTKDNTSELLQIKYDSISWIPHDIKKYLISHL